MQRQVAAAQNAAGLERRAVADQLGMSERTVNDWGKVYELPGTAHFIAWAYMCGLRLVLVEPEAYRAPVPVVLGPGESLVAHELRPVGVRLKARREARGIAQTDMGLLAGRVSRSTLQRWEDGAQVPVMLHLITWADRLGCRIVLMPESA
jgi:DNA-binding XRE family transcriptional regulator